MSKKRGFTLVEVLVVVAITTLVFAMVGGMFVFLATSSGDLIHKSESIIQAQTIEKHLRSFVDENNRIVVLLDENECKLDGVDFTDNALKIKETNKETKYEGVSSFYIYLSTKDNPKSPVDNFDSLISGDYFVNCTITIVSSDRTTEHTFVLGIYKHTEQ